MSGVPGVTSTIFPHLTSVSIRTEEYLTIAFVSLGCQVDDTLLLQSGLEVDFNVARMKWRPKIFGNSKPSKTPSQKLVVIIHCVSSVTWMDSLEVGKICLR